MAISRTDEAELLTALYEGPLEERPWSTFLARIRARVHADYAGLLFSRPGSDLNGADELFVGERVSSDLVRRYREEFYLKDPLPYRQLRPNRVYDLAQFLDVGNPDHSAFLEEFLVPAGNRHLRLMRVVEPGGRECCFILSRRDSDFRAADGALMSALAPHFVIALRHFAIVERASLHAHVIEDAARRLNLSWFTADAKGQVVDADDRARHLLSHEGGAMLDAVLAYVRKGEEESLAILLGDTPRVEMLLTPLRHRMRLGDAQAAVLAYIRTEQAAADGRPHEWPLKELYGLTRTEARLASALCRGTSLAEAAAAIGITIETARNYSKRIFAKTRTRGQVDLVGHVLGGIAALA